MENQMVCNENDFIAENENFIENFYNRIGVGGGNKKPMAALLNNNPSKKSGTFLDLDLDDTVWRAEANGRAQQGYVGDKIATAGAKGFGAADVMDNYLIMELRNNLMGSHMEEVVTDDNGKRINNSMHGVHSHGTTDVNRNIIFQD